MSFGVHEDDRGDGSLHSIDFEFEWSGEPIFRDILDDYSVGMSGDDQVTFAGEADAFFGDFIPDTILRASDRLDQFNDEDSPASTSTHGRLLPFNPTSELIESDLDTFHRRYGMPNSSWLRLPLNGERVDWNITSWVLIYEVPFRIGLRLPLPPLVSGVLSWYEIAPGQLMPNSWRILLSLEVLARRLGLIIVLLTCSTHIN